jgi:trigger factor
LEGIYALKIETQDLENRQVEITVEIPDESLQTAMRSAARRLSRNTRISGFRPGKAPYQVIVNKLGEDAVFEEALDSLGQEIYRQALDQSDLQPYAPGSLDEVVSREPLVLRYTVPLPPEVELGEYQAVRLTFDEVEVTDEAVDEMMEELRQSRALIEPADRPAQLNDVVVLDLRGELREPQENENPVLLDRKGMELILSEEMDWPIPGMSEHLIGLKAGDERAVAHTFDEDYANEKLRNLIADFHLVCQEVKSRIVPKWTDDLARSMGDFEDLLDLRMKVREGLLESAQREADAEYAQRVLDTVVEGATVSYPPILLTEEIDEMLADLRRRLAGQKLTLEDYLTIEKKSIEELRTELEPQAQERLTRALTLGKVVEAEELDVDDEEVTAKIDRMVEPYEERSDQLRKAFDHPQGRRRIALDLLTDKAMKRLVAVAKGEADLAEEIPEVQNEDNAPQGTETSKE